MLKDLDKEDRLRLMRFICSFAWADLEVQDAERSLVARMIERLDLNPAESNLARSWLEVPPRPEELDPAEIPRAHRELFLQAAREVIAADGEIDPDEAENLALFEQLLR